MKFLQFYLITLISLFSVTINSQDFQGKAYYQTKTTMDIDQWGGTELTPDQKKRMQERMKSFLEKSFVLTFDKQASIYKEVEKLETVGSNTGWGGGFASSFTPGPKYKNVKSKEQVVDQEFFGKKFLIKDSLTHFQWKMSGETKTIGQYTCFKATATRTINEFDWRSFRRRSPQESKKTDSTNTKENKTEEIQQPKTIEVIAWYTPQIPVNQGPDDYWGLPGLILEINADRTVILCTKIVLNPQEKETITPPKKGESITNEAYQKVVTKKMEEMRDMYRNRGNGSGRGRF